ncbi:MAG: acetyl-CoA carboxylase biotin carboxylase subunit [Parvibaculaceae bacterium]
MTRFTSILIANRGEIACRVIRTAQALGYRTVAVYSDADREAPHVALADEAVRVGPGPVGDSYLVAENILAAAHESGAEAIHPGYGFLSENAAFAKSVGDAGLVFIGPTADQIDLMGNKAEAKRRMIAAGVPCVPGYEGEDQADATLIAEAEKIGFPVMVKAAAGGGGRGMRLVGAKEELANAIALARSEAENAFGSGELILEKAIIRPRHVEVQVFADTLGNTIHLGERDCSVQRRHQKVIEEAPCPVMTEALRGKMGAAAVEAAKSIDYRGAGTVEFLLDEAGHFYFLEMNTRLQVEHPVTECVTGLDLVALQIRVAQGEPLGIAQEDVALTGHAIEVRLYAEDPAQDFLPATGPVDLWAPATGPGIRVDAGIETGGEVSPFYDPMLAKIIASGETREIARRRLVEALKETVLFGTKTNKAFLIACLERRAFADGAATTAFIGDEFGEGSLDAAAPSFADAAIAAALEVELAGRAAMAKSVRVAAPLRNWTNAGTLVSRKQYAFADTLFDLSVFPLGGERYRVSDPERAAEIAVVSAGDASAHIEIDGAQHVATFRQGEEFHLAVDGRTWVFADLVERAGSAEEAAGSGRIVAPMHGQILEVAVRAGDRVTKGQRLAVLEAMKMQHEILAETDGTVQEVHVEAGQQVPADDVMIEINVEEKAEA